nr:MAG: hypothetical protein DIU59_00765 [Pseudomonadota bacterium]
MLRPVGVRGQEAKSVMTKDDREAAGRRPGRCARGAGEAKRRAMLVARLWRAAERQVREIEARAKLGSRDAAEAERDARALATLARTLRGLVGFSGEAGSAPAERAGDEDGGAFRELEDFRRELARRLDRLREERAAAGASRQL